MGRERLLLVGAGHSHLHLLEPDRALLLAERYDVHLVAPATFRYSGSASATATGALPPTASRLDVAALARRADVRHLDDEVVSVDLEHRTATTAGGTRLGWDVLCLNTGSVVDPAAAGLPQTGPDVLRVKPLGDLLRLRDALTAAERSGRVLTATVVGGGASGAELAGGLAAHPGAGRVRLVSADDALLPAVPARAAGRAARVLADRGVELHLGTRVEELDGRRVRWAGGGATHDVAVLATGLVAAPAVTGALGDHRGVPVRATLRHPEHDDVFATGDCARFLPHPLPRLGVHGARQGPVLHAALLARAHGRPLPSYEPPVEALSVVDLGGGRGLAVRGRWWWEGRSALAVKRRIDSRWLARYAT